MRPTNTSFRKCNFHYLSPIKEKTSFLFLFLQYKISKCKCNKEVFSLVRVITLLRFVTCRFALSPAPHTNKLVKIEKEADLCEKPTRSVNVLTQALLASPDVDAVAQDKDASECA